MGAHSGRVFRTVLCWRRRGEWRRSLACRQTGVFRHGWISHTQDDSVHSRALDVLQERDRIFGGLGLHPHDDAVASKRDGAEQEKSAHTSLYMSPALLRWLRRDALDRGMTMNKLVVQLITEYRERQEGSQS